ncbi:MAG: hypothetical protein RBG13Loki_0514 [Promethearchaeota archaeon CR_4]|nr:MAG: hypothetical protein RBG13Loki_0514 [Candidatus Lokiarchaeota archaeon CR_4]
MLYSIFLYESATGLLIWDRNFDSTKPDQIEMFSSFFSAIKTFVRETILKGTTTDALKNIEMGDHVITFVVVKELNIDLVFITDRDDEKNVKKVTPKIIEVLMAHGNLFAEEFNGNVRKYQVLTDPIEEVLQKQKGLIDQQKSLIEDKEVFIKQLFTKRGKLDPREEETLRTEWEKLNRQLAITTNLLQKNQILEQMMHIEQRLADDQKFLNSSRIHQQLTKEISDLHYKLNYWLKETKNNMQKAISSIAQTQKSLQDADYKDAYRTLLDFSANIRKIADESLAIRFRDLARYLIDKNTIPPDVLSKAISEIMNLKDDALEIAYNA